MGKTLENAESFQKPVFSEKTGFWVFIADRDVEDGTTIRNLAIHFLQGRDDANGQGIMPVTNAVM